MAHQSQSSFCIGVRDRFPERFKNCLILDIGSLDINGNNRYLFDYETYIGIDLAKGKNVDVVAKGHEYAPGLEFDVVISTEALEHDKYWCETIKNAIKLTRSEGLYLFTCATTGRPEHGTSRFEEWASPFSHVQFDDYYMNLTEKDIRSCITPEEVFSEFKFEHNKQVKDLYFYGIKK